MSANLETLKRIIAASLARDTEAFLSHLTDDFEYYWHIDTKPLQGKEKMRKFIGNYTKAFEQRDWRIINYAEAGDLMLVEGYEELYDKAHDRVIPQPFMQACEFRDGKLAKLRDYYEPANLRPPHDAAKTTAA